MAMPRKLIPAAALAALVGFEAAVLVMIATPNVSEAYRAYFIERSTDCWPRDVSGEIELGRRVWFVKADARAGAGNLAVCGWMPAAGSGTWSIGPQSRLRFAVGGATGPLRLQLDLFAYVSDNHPRQRVVVSADGQPLRELVLDRFSERMHEVQIPAEAIGADGQVELVLDFPDARSPRELGLGDDDRRLAVRLISLLLLPAAAATAPRPPA